ncbi:hypothetical protein BN873_890150 [Candidatus Competibacter denitrificans Run_A_D11]|uniref:Peptidoglycan binding-like domain-containing protein n=1 Tax=Candidatus Competibacter denitrificans Run_A_D11 TaxID=1400863 RepID=W6MBE0_9GAMM|nr:hypothetical protein BN873_890150 [Candidatus Competibacter denitrificans Run_A_D11]
MLNKALPDWGGVSPKLTVDGICGPLTKAAIRRFQQIQLSTYFRPDGRLDPGQCTLRRLNHMLPPGSMIGWTRSGTSRCIGRNG